MNGNEAIENMKTEGYQTLDKDYGRTKMVGSGYGEIDVEQYKILESLVK
jgi:hypothetical protein